MEISLDKKSEILYDHYKDTFNHIKGYIKKRDRLFLFILVILFFLFWDIKSPLEAQEAINSFLKEKIKITFLPSTEIFKVLIWAAYLSILLQYLQLTILVDRQYDYLHGLEGKLNDLISKDFINREGKAYLEEYTLFQNWSHFFYRWVFPILLIIISSFNIKKSLCGMNLSFLDYINLILYIGILISILLYFVFGFFKK